MFLRPFSIDDAPTILSWIGNKLDFRKWSADRYVHFPASPQDMVAQYDADNIFPLTAEDSEGRVVGHIMIRFPNMLEPRARLGFVIVDSRLRGRGFGKELVRCAVDYAQQKMGAKDISLGVFLNNPSALHCYQSAGFQVVGSESYMIDGEQWEGVEMKYNG